MALQTLNTIKQWFKTGLKPTQTQFWDTWDSFRHKFEKVPIKDIEGIDELLLTKADKTILDNHLADKIAHTPQVNTDWNSESGISQLINKPEFKTINGEPLTGDGDIIIEAGGAQNLQTTLGNGNETTNSIMFNDDYYNWLKTSIDSRSIRLTDSNSDMLVGIDSAGVVTRDNSQHVSLNPQGIFFNRDTTESYLRINTSSTGISTVNLPVTEGTEITLAATEDFKTINGESILGEGDITISSAIPTLDQVLNSDNKSLTQPIVFLDEEYSSTIDSKSLSINGPLEEVIQYTGDNISWSKEDKNLKLLFDRESTGQNTFSFPEMPDSSTPYKLATDQVVSATQSGLVDNTSLQELGGVDKYVNGVRIGRGNYTGSNSNTAIGSNALTSSITGAASNTAIGRSAMSLLTSGSFNTGVGSTSLASITTGIQNVGIGSNSLNKLTTGNYNTSVGVSSLNSLTTGIQNEGFGNAALGKLTTGNYNVAVGSGALNLTDVGIGNTAVGSGAAKRVLGQYNTSIGYLSGSSAASALGGSPVDGTGSYNTTLGYQAGTLLTTGSGNVLIGSSPINVSYTEGSNNIAIYPGYNINGVTTGSNNTFIGKVTGLSPSASNLVILADGSQNVAIRKEADNRLLAPTLTNALINSGGAKSLVTKEYLDAHSGGNEEIPKLQQIYDVNGLEVFGGITTTNTKGYTYVGGGGIELKDFSSGNVSNIRPRGNGIFYLPFTDGYEHTLLSDANVKTINGQSIVGSGDISVSDDNVLHKTGNEFKEGDLNITGNLGITGNIELTDMDTFPRPPETNIILNKNGDLTATNFIGRSITSFTGQFYSNVIIGTTGDNGSKLEVNGTISTNGIKIAAALTESSDAIFNSTPVGSQRTIAGNTIQIAGATGDYFLETFRYNTSDYGMQRITFTSTASAGRFFIRTLTAGVWSAWIEKQ